MTGRTVNAVKAFLNHYLDPVPTKDVVATEVPAAIACMVNPETSKILGYLASEANFEVLGTGVRQDFEVIPTMEMSEEKARKRAIEERESREKEHTSLKSLSFLYGSYEPKYWWFEVF